MDNLWYVSWESNRRNIAHVLVGTKPSPNNPEKELLCGGIAHTQDKFTRALPGKHRVCGNCQRLLNRMKKWE